VSSADDFHGVLVEWNRTSTDGKFVPERDEVPTVDAVPPKNRLLLSEEPIEAIWLRLRQLQSVTLAKKLIERRARVEGVDLEEAVIQWKAEGVAYTLRNGSDYFQAKEGRNVSQRVLNVYYGSLAFASAEMLAAPKGAKTIAEIESSAKMGHGLYTLDGRGNGLEQLVVGVFAGFFSDWMASLGSPIDTLPEKKARRFGDLAAYSPASWVSVETLFASIPEVADLFSDIFEGKPGSRAPSARSRKLRRRVPAVISAWSSTIPAKKFIGKPFTSIKVPLSGRPSFARSSVSSTSTGPFASSCYTRSRSSSGIGRAFGGECKKEISTICAY
jgi:hypothetical protein